MPSQREGYAQKTTLVGIRVAMTKTRRAESVIVNLGQSTILGNRPPCFLILAGVPAGGAVARTLTPTGARQLIGCTGSVYFRVAGDANSLTPNNQDAHPSGSRDPCQT